MEIESTQQYEVYFSDDQCIKSGSTSRKDFGDPVTGVHIIRKSNHPVTDLIALDQDVATLTTAKEIDADVLRVSEL
jgi:hypothetical protein